MILKNKNKRRSILSILDENFIKIEKEEVMKNYYSNLFKMTIV